MPGRDPPHAPHTDTDCSQLVKHISHNHLAGAFSADGAAIETFGDETFEL